MNLTDGFQILASVAMLTISMAVPAQTAAGPAPPLTAVEQKAVHQARQAMAAERYAEAEQILNTFLEKHSSDIHYLVPFTLGNATAMAGKTAAAIRHYRRAADRYPSDPAVWQNLGKVYYDTRQYAAAGDALARAHALSPASEAPSLGYQAAVAYIMAQKPHAALPLLEGPAATDGSVPESDRLDALLQAYLDAGRHDDALALVRDILARQGHREHLWKILANIHLHLREYREAAAALEIQASLTTVQPEDIRYLGDVYQMARIPLLAARQYELLVAQGTAEADDYEKAAAAYTAARRPEKAISLLQRALERCPVSRMWWQLANIFYTRGDFQKALVAYEKCIADPPENTQAYLMIGYCALHLDRLQPARQAFVQALQYPEQRAEAETMIGQIDRFYKTSSNNEQGQRR